MPWTRRIQPARISPFAFLCFCLAGAFQILMASPLLMCVIVNAVQPVMSHLCSGRRSSRRSFPCSIFFFSVSPVFSRF